MQGSLEGWWREAIFAPQDAWRWPLCWPLFGLVGGADAIVQMDLPVAMLT